eukprot:scaffold7339_cov249-Pinguiococcus_pyrenoidosus.AAC.24
MGPRCRQAEELLGRVVDDQLRRNDRYHVSKSGPQAQEEATEAMLRDDVLQNLHGSPRLLGVRLLERGGQHHVSRVREDACNHRGQGGRNERDRSGVGLGNVLGDCRLEHRRDKVKTDLLGNGVRHLLGQHGVQAAEGREGPLGLPQLVERSQRPRCEARVRHEADANVLRRTEHDGCNRTGDRRRQQEVQEVT